MELIGLSANLKRPMRYLHCTVHLYYYDIHKVGLSSLGLPWHPQILANQLTLSQLGGQIMLTNHSGTPDFQTFLRPCKALFD